MDRSFISASKKPYHLISLIISFFFFTQFPPQLHSASFNILNKCRYSVWPGLLSGANSPPLPTTGFFLRSGSSKTLTIPKSWSGRIWARTFCRHKISGIFSCATGDCGSGLLNCSGAGAKPPATLAEFTLNGNGGLDFYDVSLVDGYNLPMLVVPARDSCAAMGCLVDLNGACPASLTVSLGKNGRSVGCMSACEAFGDPRFCCSGSYATPETCGPSAYSEFFKHACPRAYSYAYDDKTSTFTCPSSVDYLVVFCPFPYTRNSEKAVGGQGKAREVMLPLVNKSAMYIGTHHSNDGSSISSLEITVCLFIQIFSIMICLP